MANPEPPYPRVQRLITLTFLGLLLLTIAAWLHAWILIVPTFVIVAIWTAEIAMDVQRWVTLAAGWRGLYEDLVKAATGHLSAASSPQKEQA